MALGGYSSPYKSVPKWRAPWAEASDRGNCGGRTSVARLQARMARRPVSRGLAAAIVVCLLFATIAAFTVGGGRDRRLALRSEGSAGEAYATPDGGAGTVTADGGSASTGAPDLSSADGSVRGSQSSRSTGPTSG